MDNYLKKIDLYFELKNLPDSTRESMGRRIRAFLIYIQALDIPYEDISFEDIQGYLLHLKRDRGLAPGTINNYQAAIKFFYTYTLEKQWDPIKVPRMKRPASFPVIPPRNDVYKLLNATTNLKHKAIFALIYGSGLRVSEVARLKISDIDSQEMRVRVDQAKHQTNRYTILSESALQVLREYFKSNFTRSYDKNGWLFPGKDHKNHLHVKTIKNTFLKVRNQLELDTKISAHTLRHCFATHSLEDGIESVLIQHMLGHKRLQTTLGYLHMTSKSMMGVMSPLDRRKGHDK